MSATQDEAVVSLWHEDSTRPAGFRQTLKIGSQEYGFCWIPAGEFDMGSPKTEEERNGDETLHHVVLTRGFWMLETPVTQALYQEIMGDNPSEFEGENLPVECVSWYDAQKFCAELTKLLPEGLNASLPTESQWEYACRAGTTTPYSFGSVLNGDKANCDGRYPYGTEKKGTCRGETSPVKSYAPNPWGLYDMHGNVWEWTSDYHDLYPEGTVVDPKGPDSGFHPVVRGGVWVFGADYCRSAARVNGLAGCRGNSYGFRFLLSNKRRIITTVNARRDDAAVSLWREDSTRPAGFRQTLKIRNAEYGFCWIPAGEFDMGTPEPETGTETELELWKYLIWREEHQDEKLHHVVLTRGFWMLETPVTQALYQEIMGENPSGFEGENLPVERVSWYDAEEFCGELTTRLPEGLKAGLPTESQWEYACKAGTTTLYSFGSVLNGDHANSDGSCPYGAEEEGAFGKTRPVKSYAPNAWGLYDMHGNVWEWTSDFYGEYPEGTVVDPRGPDSASFRVSRGGSWFINAKNCWSSDRGRYLSVYRDCGVGFRFLLIYD